MAKRRSTADMMRRALKKADTTILLYAVVLFQVSAMLLLSFKNQAVDRQTLMLTFVMPVSTVALVRGLTRLWKVDGVILIMVLFLCSLSVITLTAIARSLVTPLQQAIYIGVGLLAMIAVIAVIRVFRHWKRWRILLMLGSLGFIALPLLIGEYRFGAKNWISIIPNRLSVQPSEFVKVTLAVTLADLLSERQSLKTKAVAVVFGAVLCGILLLEKDLGALLLYFLMTLLTYFVATSNALISLSGLGAGAVGSVGAYYLFDHVKTRITVWLNPWADYEKSGYQIIQALIAIGSGGAIGMGLGLGMPRMIPLYHSDFIFASICEQFGYVFALGLLAVYGVIVLRGISVSMSCRDGFHSLLSFALSVLLGLQTLLIVGGNVRLLPLTGVTLPFIAEGGSSVVSCLAAVGVILGISSMNAEQDQADVRRAEWQEADS